jgi:hypothetical protein
MYFAREETTLAVRAFTHGYDLFHPGEHILWHEHAGRYRRRHWEDHPSADAGRVPWQRRHRQAIETVAAFFTAPATRPFGIGDARSLADYEAYAGISFRDRVAQDHTRAHRRPPNPAADPDWPSRLRRHRVEIEIDLARIAAESAEPGVSWFVALRDAAGHQLWRRDAAPDELRAATDDGHVRLIREFSSEAPPVTWTVVPRHPVAGWLAPVSGPVAAGATSAVAG